MTPAEIIHQCEAAGLHLDTDGEDILAAPPDRLTDALRATLREHKAEVLAALANRQEQARDHVWQELQARPDKIKYFEVIDPAADPVRLVLAIRGVGTCDLLIDRDRWDPFRFLELLDSRITEPPQ